ncbi:MAG: hypothetical protein HC836_30360 [Richelia sp. RM2_1_2]|nr:hypothetical protein [Richelia sp. RM2_1_2]
MAIFDDVNLTVTCGEKSQSLLRWLDWCKDNKIEYDYSYPASDDGRFADFRLKFFNNSNYMLFKLTWA